MAIGQGNIVVKVPNGPTTTNLELKEAAYAPSMVFTLISIGQLDSIGCYLLFGNQRCAIKEPGSNTIIARLPRINRLYQAPS
jgi:hypothetical protein